MTRLEKARARFLKTGHRDPSSAQELEQTEDALIGEIDAELNDTIKNLTDRIRKSDRQSSEEIAVLKQQVQSLEGRLKDRRKRK